MALALVATMSYSDSTAVFKKRFLEVGLTEANFEAFNAEGLNTMGTFAFACNYAPGSADERPLTTLATNILGAAPSTKEMACIRRLFSEAYSTIAADIRSKVEASDEAAVKKLAPAERSQRLYEQQQRYQRQFRAWRLVDRQMRECIRGRQNFICDLGCLCVA